ALRRTGAGVLLLDYRGYGGSGGAPTEEGLYRDGEAAAAWVEAQGLGPLVYVGESLGTGVAVEVALRRPPAALVLQSPFTSLTDVAARHYPYLPVRLLLKDRYESLEKIARVSCPVLVIHGDRDSIIPIAQGRKLFEAVPGRKAFLEVPGGDHNDPLWDLLPGYAERVGGFLGL
ncbi:MAG: alpha/beta hydrolase, partial [Candidatus Methylomirabilales bacterium]